jgi:hypothetical protein
MNHIRRIRRSLAGLTRRAAALPGDGMAVPAAVAIPPRPPGWTKALTAARLHVGADRVPDAGRAAARGRQRRRTNPFIRTAPGIPPHTIQLCIHCQQRPAGFWVRRTGDTVVRRPWCLSCCQDLDRDPYDLIPFGG